MSVKVKHTQYTEMISEWEKCSDFMTSAKAVKERGNGKTYLPVLSEQTAEEYKAYKDRAPVVMFAQRANKSMCGMIGRKEALVSGVPSGSEYLLDSIDSQENSLQAYISMVTSKYLGTGRGATLIDMPKVESKLTVQQAEDQGIRPRFFYYDESAIINWKFEKINNVDTLTLVVLLESVNESKAGDDVFTWEAKDQYRVLELRGGIYVVSLYDHDGNLVPESETMPKKEGEFLTQIPIVFHGGLEVQQPPLNSIVDINKHHYQLAADEIWGLRMAALPTAYFFGHDPKDKDFPVHTGPGKVIGSEDVNAKTGFREFSGAGMASVAAKLKQWAEDIAMLSVQMATEQLNKSATGSSIDYGNSTASLAGVSSTLSAEMTKALKWSVWWDGGDDKDVQVVLNMDFMPTGMDSNMLAQLLKTYLSGAITYETFYKNLAKGEITDPHKDPEEEMREIEEALPAGMQFDLGNEEEDEEDQDTGDQDEDQEDS